MAVSEDISEKVANVLFEYLLRSANYVTDTAPAAIGAVGKAGEKAFDDTIKFAQKLLKKTDLSKYLDKSGHIPLPELNALIKELKSHARTIRIGDGDVSEFEAMLRSEKMLYTKLDMQDDNCRMFMYMDSDAEKVQNAISALKIRRGTVTELSPNLFVQALQPEHTLTVSGLGSVELELFRHYARETGVLFTAINRPDGNMLIIPAEDAQKVHQALGHTNWALTGRNGAVIREQIEHRLKGRTAINISAEEGEREVYVVSRIHPGNYVKISSDDYKVYKDHKQISTVSRTAESFSSRCIAACDALSHPVVLSPEEYAEMTSETLQQAHTVDLFPDGFDDMVEMNIFNRLQDLLSQKRSLDDEGNTPLDLSDPSITYSEFTQYEYIADEEERQGRELEFEHFKRAHAYSKETYVFAEVERNGKSLDFIVSQAEAKKREILEDAARQNREKSPLRGEQQPGLI